jgi:hypothetical protein
MTQSTNADLSVLNRDDPDDRLIVALWEVTNACADVLRAHNEHNTDEPCDCAFCHHAMHLPYVVDDAATALALYEGGAELSRAWRQLRGEHACQSPDDFAYTARPDPLSLRPLPGDEGEEADEPSVIDTARAG